MQMQSQNQRDSTFRGIFEESVMMFGPTFLSGTRVLIIILWVWGLGELAFAALMVWLKPADLSYLEAAFVMLKVGHGTAIIGALVLTLVHRWLRGFILRRMPEGSYLLL